MRNAFLYLLVLFCVLFAALKIQHLSLPFFWDEAWPYSTGVFYMYANGLSLLPGSVPFDISRGHPLLFHFLSALWMKMFGTSLIAIHLFSLLISLALVICVYFFCVRFFSKAVALASCILLMAQPVFFSQSSMLLPEVLVALLTLITFWTFLRERKLFYILFTALLLLTKESGIVIVIALFCWLILEKIFLRSERKWVQVVIDGIYLLIPVTIAFTFFVLQKMETGHFFLPMYVSEDNFSWTLFSEKLKNYFAYVFIYQGRNILSLFLIVAAVIYVFRKLKIPHGDKRIIFPMTIFIPLYLLFSSFSFYSPRYMLSVLPFVIIISTHMVFTAADKRKIIFIGFVLVALTVSISYCLRKKPVNDHSPGFTDGIMVTQNAVNYYEGVFDKNVYSSFLLRMHLTHPEHGYLNTKTFYNVTDTLDDTVDICIFVNYELDNYVYHAVKQQSNFKLVKRFEKNYAWSEVYERTN